MHYQRAASLDAAMQLDQRLAVLLHREVGDLPGDGPQVVDDGADVAEEGRGEGLLSLHHRETGGLQGFGGGCQVPAPPAPPEGLGEPPPRPRWGCSPRVLEVGLVGAGIASVEMSFAGVSPFPLLGRRPDHTWTTTSGIGEQVEYFIERQHHDDPYRYWHGGEWKAMERRTEVTQVRGRDPVRLEVLRTVRGPAVRHDSQRDTGALPALKTAAMIRGTWNRIVALGLGIDRTVRAYTPGQSGVAHRWPRLLDVARRPGAGFRTRGGAPRRLARPALRTALSSRSTAGCLSGCAPAGGRP